MKKIILFLILLLPVVYTSAQDVELIRPKIESPVMNLNEANTFMNSQNFKNWGIKKLGLDSVMMNLSGDSVKVCICDTGKPSHPDLKDKILESKNFTNDQSDSDGNGHSTHVAGIIHEIAPDAELLFAKVLSDSGFGSNDGVAAGIQWCVNRDAKIINLSLSGSNPSSSIKSMIDFAVKEKVLIVAAAGNNGQSSDKNTMGYPARYEETLATGSINSNLDVSLFSSSGEEGDLVAPGEQILSTWTNGDYVVLSGTSMSAPYTSGVAALHYQKHKTNTGVELLFEVGSEDISPQGFDRYSFWGHISPTNIFMKRDTSKTDPPVETNPDDKFIFPEWLNIVIPALTLIILILTFFLSRRNSKRKNEKIEELNKEIESLKKSTNESS